LVVQESKIGEHSMKQHKVRWADRENVAAPKRLGHKVSRAPIQRNRPVHKLTGTSAVTEWISPPLTTRLRNKV
jgi:hypothetical protein